MARRRDVRTSGLSLQPSLSVGDRSIASAQRRRSRTDVAPWERGPQLEPVLEDMRRYMHRGEEANLKFMCEYDLRRIVLEHAHRLFSFEDWTAQQRHQVIDRCYRILGILVASGAFTQVARIKDIFFREGSETPVLTDKNLEKNIFYNEAQLHFLKPPTILHSFLDQQYILNPYRFRERYPSRTLDVPYNARLPFYDVKDSVGSGAFGIISEVTIARYYYVDADGHTFEKDKRCALKQLRTSDDLRRELRQLDILKESLVEHKRILMHYVAFNHGQTFNILLPLAEYGNLEVFLKEGADPDRPNGPPQYSFADKFPRFDRNNPRCTQDLLAQISNIVDAVRWMHGGEVRGLEIIHRDLKPDNILIMEDPTTDKSRKSTVGRWQLTDLGISVLRAHRTVTVGDAISILENRTPQGTISGSRTYILRGPGTYTAPEIEQKMIVKQSDVWSLACILAQVLAFALGGNQMVHDFETQRRRGKQDDQFYSYSNKAPTRLGTSQSQGFELRSAVSTWLNDVAQNRDQWVKCCVRVILRTLDVDPEPRPQATYFDAWVKHVKEHYLNEEMFRHGDQCPDLNLRPKTPLATMPSSPPLTTSHRWDSLSMVPTGSSSTASENRSESVTSMLPLTLNLKASPVENPQIHYFRDRQFKGKQASALDVSICPTGAHALWLFKTCSKPQEKFQIDFTGLNASSGPSSPSTPRPVLRDPRPLIAQDETVDLPEGIRWHKISVGGGYAAVQGKPFDKKSQSTKYFRFYDFNQHPVRAIQVQEHPEMLRVGRIVMSSQGFVVLQANSKLLLYDLFEVNSDLEPLGVEKGFENYHFCVAVDFSASGDCLAAWCYGTGLSNALYIWYIDAENRAVSPGYRYPIQTDPSSPPIAARNVLLAPASDEDGSIAVVVHDSRGKFFRVRLNGRPGPELSRDDLTPEANGAVACVVYKGSHLVTLARSSSSISKPYQLIGYSLQHPMNATGIRKGALWGDLNALAKLEACETRIVPHGHGLSVIMLTYDTKFRRWWYSEDD